MTTCELTIRPAARYVPAVRPRRARWVRELGLHFDVEGPANDAVQAWPLLAILASYWYSLLPMAPPRMLPGFVDTLASTSGAGWWGGEASAPKGLGALTNQLAAMPSLHVGWAVWVAWVVVGLSTHRWVRMVAVAYPVITTLVVVATANHYLLDAVAGAAVVGVGFRLARYLARRPAGWHLRRPGQSSASGSSTAASARTVESSRRR